MKVRRMRRNAVRCQHRMEAATNRVAQAAFDAHVSLYTCEYDRSNSAFAQKPFCFGICKRAEGLFHDHRFRGVRFHLEEAASPCSRAATNLPTPALEFCKHPFRQALRIVVCLYPINGHTCSPSSVHQVHNRWNHCSARRRISAYDALYISFLSTKIVLHVDHHDRHVRRAKPIFNFIKRRCRLYHPRTHPLHRAQLTEAWARFQAIGERPFFGAQYLTKKPRPNNSEIFTIIYIAKQ
jgi:hypothetical protein